MCTIIWCVLLHTLLDVARQQACIRGGLHISGSESTSMEICVESAPITVLNTLYTSMGCMYCCILCICNVLSC